MLGIDILSHFNAFIDFDAQELVWYSKDSVPGNVYACETQLPFDTYSPTQKTPVVTLTIDGNEEDFIWDTGYDGDFVVQFHTSSGLERWVENHPHTIKYESEGGMRDISGKSGRRDLYYLRTDTLYNGKNAIRINPTYIVYTANPHLPENHANIGTGFMKDYKVFLSWKDNKIYLHRTNTVKEARTLPVIAAKYDEGANNISIVAVQTGSTADKSGLQPGDILTAVEDLQTNDIISTAGKCGADSTVKKALETATYVTTQRLDKVRIR